MLPEFSSEYLQEWDARPVRLPVFLFCYSSVEKARKEESANRFIKSVKQMTDKRRLHGRITAAEEKRFLHDTHDFFGNALDFGKEQLNVIFSAEMIAATRSFVWQARKFDPSITFSETFQALRNAWIMFGVQLIFSQPVELTPSIFAYSMLYPYTDNLIDDAGISSLEKLAFSNRFRDRLSGRPTTPESLKEQTIYKLVEMIEQQYPRRDYPDVYAALLAIHDAQTSSLSLQGGVQLSEMELLKICMDKGGASVLADGFLVAGKLNPEQQSFLFGYGAFLQMLDDIQDVKDDLQAGLTTYFGSDVDRAFLDWKVQKTYQFGDQVLERLDQVGGNYKEAFKVLIRRSMDLFVAEAIAQNPELYSPEFASIFEAHSPFRFAYIRLLESRFSTYHGFLITAAREIALSPEAGVFA